MIRFLRAGTGSKWHSKITDQDYRQAQAEYAQEKSRNPDIGKQILNDIISWIETRVGNADWFDKNALLVAGDAVAEQLHILGHAFSIRQRAEGVASEFFLDNFSTSLITKAEDAQFKKICEKHDQLATTGFMVFYGEGGPGAVSKTLSAGIQVTRLLVGPFSFVLGRIPYVALVYYLIWVTSALVDWVVVGLPYLIWRVAQGVPTAYLDAEIDHGSYVFGDSKLAKEAMRNAVRNRQSSAEAFATVLIAMWLEYKLIETVRKNRSQ